MMCQRSVCLFNRPSPRHTQQLARRLRCMRPSGHVKRGTTSHAVQSAALLLCITTAATVSAGTPSWRQCSPGGPALEIHGVNLEPLPPRRGQDFQYQLEATANAPVQQAALTATVYYWGVPVYTQQGLLCNSSDSGIEVTCPIAPGPVSMAYHGHMPDSAPLGRYSLRIMAADAGSGATLMCVDAWFGVSHAPPSIVGMWWQLIRDRSRAAFGSSSVQRGNQQEARPAAPVAVAA